MAVVYRALHRRLDVDVALKVLQKRSTSEGLDLQLESEVRAAARMRHPNIVNVLDVGVMPYDVHLGEDVIHAGQSFYVMEFVDGPSLDAHPALPWLGIKELLLHVLDGLAHAHARGVVHRDLKPSNILIETTSRGLLPKIGDFGIARLDVSFIQNESDSFQGTPAYMAPEQIRGHERDLGPWTDLYALGCLAYELVTGRTPFVGEHYMQILQQHLHAAPPRLPEGLHLPEGFESWLARLLTKNPLRRFIRAVDAAISLLRLAPLVGNPYPLSTLASACEGEQTFVSATQTLMFGDTLLVGETQDVDPVDAGLSMPGVSRVRVHAPPMPSSWTSREGVDAVWHRSMALALFEVRPVPLIGRRSIQDELWSALRDVRESGQSRCIVLRGPAGVGKTKLADWLAVLADEIGVANLLRAYHDEDEPESYGLGGMFLRYFRILGLATDDALERVRTWARETGYSDYIPIVSEVVTRATTPSNESLDRLSSDGAIAIMRMLTKVVESDRPVLIVLDDLPRSDAALTYATSILAEDDMSALILVTADSELTGEASRRLETLLGMERTRVIEVGDLPAADRIELFEGYLGMQPDDARTLADYADGNPMLSLELIRNLIAQGVLRETPQGFVMDRGASIELPPRMRGALRRRIELFVESVPASERETTLAWLELGAVFGTEFSAEEWARACAHAEITVPDELFERAVSHRLITRTGSRWRFPWRLLRDELIQEAQESGRLAWLHEVCHGAIVDDGGEITQGRRVLHQFGSGTRSLEALVDAAEALLLIHNVGMADEILEAFIAAAGTIHVEVDSLIVGRALAAFARVHAFGRYASASIPAGREAYRIARLHDDAELMARACRVDLLRQHLMGSCEATLAAARAVVEIVPRVEQPALRAAILSDVALAATYIGEAAMSLRFARQALENAHLLSKTQRWILHVEACEAAIHVGALSEGLERLDILESLPADQPVLRDVIVMNLKVAAALTREDFETALSLLEEQASLPGVRNRWQTLLANLWRQLCYAQIESWRVSEAVLERLVPNLAPQTYEHAIVRQLQCVQALRKGDAALAARRVDEYEIAFQAGRLNYLLALSTDWAAETSERLGHPEIAARLWTAAHAQWRRLGREERAVSAHARLHAVQT
jgi:eukaryotic-like serine/threonine-protein kinase